MSTYITMLFFIAVSWKQWLNIIWDEQLISNMKDTITGKYVRLNDIGRFIHNNLTLKIKEYLKLNNSTENCVVYTELCSSCSR